MSRPTNSPLACEVLRVSWAYGATVARLTPDQKVERSNRSGLTVRRDLILVVACGQLCPLTSALFRVFIPHAVPLDNTLIVITEYGCVTPGLPLMPFVSEAQKVLSKTVSRF